MVFSRGYGAGTLIPQQAVAPAGINVIDLYGMYVSLAQEYHNFKNAVEADLYGRLWVDFHNFKNAMELRMSRGRL